MRYCKKCLQPDTRPGIYFDKNQICGACIYEKSKEYINWDKRERNLKSIVDWAKDEKKKRNISYDCIIGVSGGKDSTFQAFYAKEKLGLHPLLVNCIADEITDVGRHNIDNLSSHGFDIIHIRPNPVVAKTLARRSFFEHGNIVKASEYCLWASAFKVAVQMYITLVIQGENAALTLGVSKGLNTDGNAFGVFDANTLKESINIWEADDITKDMLFLYTVPSQEEYRKKNIQSIWLQFYAKEWSQVSNAEFAVARGLRGRDTENLYDIGMYRRHSGLDNDLIIANQMLKYLKFGFGATTDLVCYDIRENRISREDAKWLVNEYDGKCGKYYIELACNFLDVSKSEFWGVVDSFANKKLFMKKNNKWIPRFKVGIDFV